MGLDIVAVNRIKRIICNVDAEGWPIDPVTGARLDHETLFRGYQNPDFPGVADEIEEGTFYGFEKSVSFNAGSYSSFGGWRDKLAALAGWPKSRFWHYAKDRWAESHCARCWAGETGPFSDLIDFSDCSGLLGASEAARLASNFAQYQSLANRHEDEDMRCLYNKWRSACELAADEGCIIFC